MIADNNDCYFILFLETVNYFVLLIIITCYQDIVFIIIDSIIIFLCKYHCISLSVIMYNAIKSWFKTVSNHRVE